MQMHNAGMTHVAFQLVTSMMRQLGTKNGKIVVELTGRGADTLCNADILALFKPLWPRLKNRSKYEIQHGMKWDAFTAEEQVKLTTLHAAVEPVRSTYRHELQAPVSKPPAEHVDFVSPVPDICINVLDTREWTPTLGFLLLFTSSVLMREAAAKWITTTKAHGGKQGKNSVVISAPQDNCGISRLQT